MSLTDIRVLGTEHVPEPEPSPEPEPEPEPEPVTGKTVIFNQVGGGMTVTNNTYTYPTGA